jgi:hypothetical protein
LVEIKCRVNRGAVYFAPHAKRIKGPKLLAAIGPTKYNPFTLDSKCEESTGASAVDLMDARRLGAMKGSLLRFGR